MKMSLSLKITTINPGLYPPDRIHIFSCELYKEPSRLFEPRFIINPNQPFYENRFCHIRRFVTLETVDTDEINAEDYVKILLEYLNKHHRARLFEDDEIPEIEKKIKESMPKCSASCSK